MGVVVASAGVTQPMEVCFLSSAISVDLEIQGKAFSGISQECYFLGIRNLTNHPIRGRGE